MTKSKRIPCPFCGGEVLLLDCFRYKKQRPSINKNEFVCQDCGVVVNWDMSDHKKIKAWNRRVNKRIKKEIPEESNEQFSVFGHNPI